MHDDFVFVFPDGASEHSEGIEPSPLPPFPSFHSYYVYVARPDSQTGSNDSNRRPLLFTVEDPALQTSEKMRFCFSITFENLALTSVRKMLYILLVSRRQGFRCKRENWPEKRKKTFRWHH